MASEDDGPSASTWAQARESSHQMILQAALEDLESKAAQWEQELVNAKAAVEEQKAKIASLEGVKNTLQSSLEDKTTELNRAKGSLQKESSKVQSLEESQTQTTERLDRVQAESDSLREEIRYVGSKRHWTFSVASLDS